jgi:hypothetical protein
MFAKTSFALLAGPALLVSAFPEIARMVAEKRLQERQTTPQILEFPEFPGTPNHALFNQFDPELQLVNTTGEHEWRAPGSGDIRGPCAGLNAAANHGYIQRDGVVDAQSINTGLWRLLLPSSMATQSPAVGALDLTQIRRALYLPSLATSLVTRLVSAHTVT